MRTPNRRLLESTRQPCESSKWSWLDDVVQTRASGFIEDVGRGPLGQSWVFLCEGSGLHEPGAFFTDEIAGRLVLICRTQDRVLKGFRNVCPHLGAPVERNRHGRTRSFICPYHAWTFSLDGRLASVPLPEGYDGSGFRKEDFGLPEIPTTSVGSLVFGSINDTPSEPRAHFGEAAAYVEGLFPVEAQWDIIFACTVQVELWWEDWIQRTRQAYADGVMAESFGIAQEVYRKHRRLIWLPQGHQIALARDIDFAGVARRYGIPTQGWGSGIPQFLREQGVGGCVVHLAPNLVIAGVGDALATLRADPVDEHLTLVRILGYGQRGEPSLLRRARQRQLQLWWGPYAAHVWMTARQA